MGESDASVEADLDWPREHGWDGVLPGRDVFGIRPQALEQLALEGERVRDHLLGQHPVRRDEAEYSSV